MLVSTDRQAPNLRSVLDPGTAHVPKVSLSAAGVIAAAYLATAAVIAGPVALALLLPVVAAGIALVALLGRARDRVLVGDALLRASDGLDAAVTLADRDLQIVAASTGAVALTGRSREALVGADAVGMLTPDAQPLARERGRLRAAGFEPPPRLLATLQRQDGTAIPIEAATVSVTIGDRPFVMTLARPAPQMKEPGPPVRCMDVIRDETTAPHDCAADLERAHAELDRLVSILVHDLREPLRAVNGFSELLEREAAEELSERSHEFLEMVREAGLRMDRLVDGLALYGRAGRRGQPAEIDLDDVLDAALRQRASDLGGARVTADDLPVLHAEPAGVQRLLEELIVNAATFNAHPQPHVHVAAARRRGGWQLTVTDDGLGVPERERDRVFEMFRRLHPRGAYPGDGVGLAVCRRIVQRHGGRIWIEDGPSGGSTVCVFLPESEAAA